MFQSAEACNRAQHKQDKAQGAEKIGMGANFQFKKTLALFNQLRAFSLPQQRELINKQAYNMFQTNTMRLAPKTPSDKIMPEFFLNSKLALVSTFSASCALSCHAPLVQFMLYLTQFSATKIAGCFSQNQASKPTCCTFGLFYKSFIKMYVDTIYKNVWVPESEATYFIAPEIVVCFSQY